MEVDNILALGIDLQTETNTFDVKTEVIENDHYQHNHDMSSDINYIDTAISDMHVTAVKLEPEDEPSRTSDHTEYIIEIDTCKDEYYEKHGYPSNNCNVNLEEGVVETESGEDYLTKDDAYTKHILHSDNQHVRYVDTKPCSLVLHDIRYTYPDSVTHGYVHVYNKEPIVEIHVQSTEYGPALQQSKHKPCRCSVCGVEFTRKGNMNAHMTIHTGEKPHKCSVCGVRFRLKATLTSHIRTHAGEKPYRCIFCGVGFKQECTLKMHTRMVHKGEKPHKCSVCEVSFSRKSDLTSHMRTHTGEKPYKCSVCGVFFSRKTTLMSHQRIHTGVKPYKCHLCGRGFAQAANLQYHMAMHTGDKPHTCSVCGVGFTLKGDLNRHISIHTGVKPHKCSVCEVSFRQKAHLVSHMRTHTG